MWVLAILAYAHAYSRWQPMAFDARTTLGVLADQMVCKDDSDTWNWYYWSRQ